MYKTLLFLIYILFVVQKCQNLATKGLISLKRYVNYPFPRIKHLFQSTKSLDDDKWDPTLYPKLDFKEDYYKVLEVDPKADQTIIKKAYYKMVFKYHPDNKKTEKEKALANKQMMVINNAYKILRDESLKAAYDAKKSNAVSSKTSSSSTQQKQYYYKKKDASIPLDMDTSDIWNYGVGNRNSYGNIDSNDEDETGESLLDILADMWTDIQYNKGMNLIDDLNQFLEDKDFDNDSRNLKQKSTPDLEQEIETITKTVSTIEMHKNDLKKTLDLEKALLIAESKNKYDSNSVEELKSKLKKEEIIKGLEARMTVVQKQIRNLLKMKEKNFNEIIRRKSSTYNNNNSNSNSDNSSNRNYRSSSSESNASTTISKKQIIDKELENLKKKLGL